MVSDLNAVKRRFLAQEEEEERLKEELAEQKSHEPLLHSKISQPSLQCELLQETISESKKSRTRELASCHETAAAHLREVEAAWKRTQNRCQQLEEKLTSAQKEKGELRISLAKVGELIIAGEFGTAINPYIHPAERQQSSLHTELLEVRNHETALHSSQAALRGKLDQLQTELSQCKSELETGRLELSKTTALNHTLQRKNKV